MPIAKVKIPSEKNTVSTHYSMMNEIHKLITLTRLRNHFMWYANEMTTPAY